MEYNKKHIVKKIRVLDEYIDLILKNTKKSTIRQGIVIIKNKLILIEYNKRKILVKITKIDYSKRFGDLNENYAITDGFKSLSDLKNQLKSFYPDISKKDPITIINFEKV